LEHRIGISSLHPLSNRTDTPTIVELLISQIGVQVCTATIDPTPLHPSIAPEEDIKQVNRIYEFFYPTIDAIL